MSKDKDNDARPPIGSGHAGAMGRLGWKEIRGAVYPGSNIAQPSEYGLYGTKTPGEVAEDRREDERDPDEEPFHGSVLYGFKRESEAARGGGVPEPEREEPEMER
jgi:hypothetical protein